MLVKERGKEIQGLHAAVSNDFPDASFYIYFVYFIIGFLNSKRKTKRKKKKKLYFVSQFSLFLFFYCLFSSTKPNGVSLRFHSL